LISQRIQVRQTCFRLSRLGVAIAAMVLIQFLLSATMDHKWCARYQQQTAGDRKRKKVS
jgi:hypothetical protein